MKSLPNSRAFLITSLLASSTIAPHAQIIDWGSWSNSGNGSYINNDSILISGIVNGSASASHDETDAAHINIDPAFPYSNAPGAHEYGFFHNADPTVLSWSIKIDLSNFVLAATSVIGFSNLDGRDLDSLTSTYANIEFLDEFNNPVSIVSATYVGNFDYSWTGTPWDAASNYNLSNGIWDVTPDSGSTHPSGTYSAAVGNAFFLTNLPANISSIVYTKYGQTNYTYDSTLFYAGHVVPEPSCVLLASIAGGLFAIRRRRDAA
jgi:hypothetical protein